MPFHATCLALAVPPLAAGLTLALLGAAPISARLIASALAPAYVLGGVPAFLAARLDAALARRGWTQARRLVVAAGLAGLAGLVILAPVALTGGMGGALPLILPAACAVAAVAALQAAMLLAWLLKPPANPGARPSDPS